MRTPQARIAAATDRLRKHAPFLVTLVLLPQLPLLTLVLVSILVPGAEVLGLLSGMAFFLAVPLWNAALLHALGRLSDRGELDIPEAYRAAGAMYYRMLPVVMLSLLAVFAGFLMLVIPGIYLGMRLALAQCACVFEGARDVPALKRSWQLTKGHAWELLFYVLLVAAPPLAVEMLGSLLLGPEPARAPLALHVFTGQLVSVASGVVFLILLQELYRDAAATLLPASGPGEVLMVPIKKDGDGSAKRLELPHTHRPRA